MHLIIGDRIDNLLYDGKNIDKLALNLQRTVQKQHCSLTIYFWNVKARYA